jgi:hypothetical protein
LDGIDFAEAKEKDQALSFNIVLCNFSFDQKAFQTAAHNYENKLAPSWQRRRKVQATAAVNSKTWIPVCHLSRQPSYVWLNRRNLYIYNSGALFL